MQKTKNGYYLNFTFFLYFRKIISRIYCYCLNIFLVFRFLNDKSHLIYCYLQSLSITEALCCDTVELKDGGYLNTLYQQSHPATRRPDDQKTGRNTLYMKVRTLCLCTNFDMLKTAVRGGGQNFVDISPSLKGSLLSPIPPLI